MTQPEINPPATAIATIELVSPTTGQSVTIPVPVFEMIPAELAEQDPQLTHIVVRVPN